jgi:hypothetical protein
VTTPEAAERDQGQVARCRQRLAAGEGEEAEDDRGHREPTERERAGREVVAGGADPDERRRPQHDRDPGSRDRRRRLRGSTREWKCGRCATFVTFPWGSDPEKRPACRDCG